jgi:dGTPase
VNERTRQWAATMRGTADPTGVRRAHADSVPSSLGSGLVGTDTALPTRTAREAAEAEWLAFGATRAVGAGQRVAPEAPDPVRTCFERDRDRILHSSSFRRLAGKTQVFVFPNDHQRTRLTHALEVAQIARSVASACRLNVALTEAIALGHDCGHGPGGHASEDAFAPLLVDGFDHAVWGADVALADLNLCHETLDGIRNHSWSRPAPGTPEGEVVSWADRIAYVCHDFEDAVSAGIVTTDDLPAEVRSLCGTERREQLAAFVHAMLDAASGAGTIGMFGPHADALAAFRRFNYEHIYLRPESRAQGQLVVRVLQALVEDFAHRPSTLPAQFSPLDAPTGSADAVWAAVRYVAGMTDRYAFNCARENLGWDPAALPVGIDLAD